MGALIFVVGLLTGMQVGGNGVDIAALVLLSYLVSLSATLFAAGVAMRLRTMQAGPLMQMPVFLVLFLAPVYVPLPLLSGWVHAVATVNPITPIIETGRDFISGTPGPIALAYAIGAAMVALFAWWAARGLRSAESRRASGCPTDIALTTKHVVGALVSTRTPDALAQRAGA